MSSATTRRQLAALDRLPDLQDQNNRREVAVRALLLSTQGAEKVASQNTSWAERQDWREAAGRHLGQIEGLNASQRRAVATALTRTFTLWQVGHVACAVKPEKLGGRGVLAGRAQEVNRKGQEGAGRGSGQRQRPGQAGCWPPSFCAD